MDFFFETFEFVGIPALTLFKLNRASCKTMFEVDFERKLRSCGYHE